MDLELLKIEKKIIEFYILINEIFGRDRNQAIIYAYSLSYQKITQEFLKERTGFSAGLISASFKIMVYKKILRIDPFNTSRKKSYILNIPEFSLVMKDRGVDNLNKDKILSYITNFVTEDMKSLSDFEMKHLVKRIFDLMFSFLFNKYLIKHNARAWELGILNIEPLISPYSFSEDFCLVEKKLIDHLLAINYLQESDEKMAIILYFFITREVLSLKKLRQITKFSDYAIRMRLKELNTIGMISKISSTRFYQMKSYSISNIHFQDCFFDLLQEFNQYCQKLLIKFRNPVNQINLLEGHEVLHSHLDQINHHISKELQTLDEPLSVENPLNYVSDIFSLLLQSKESGEETLQNKIS